MKIKKLLALGMAATMMVSSSLVAFAEEATQAGGTTGAGKVEGVVDTEVFSVVLPTVLEDGSTLAFVLDPQGLIHKTSGAAYESSTFEDGATLFFKNASGSTTYSSTSDVLKVTNKSSVKADVTVTAKITGNEGIALSSDKNFADDTSASMYMAVVEVANPSPAAITDADGVKLTATMDAAPADAFEYTYNSDTKKYSYGLKAEDQLASITFEKYEFKLTGASNAKGDWTGLDAVTPSVEVTWNVTKHVDNAAPTFTTGAGVGEINYTAGAGNDGLASITSITMVLGGTAFDGYNAAAGAWDAATDSAGKITFSDVYIGYYAATLDTCEATITYATTGGETKTAKVTVKCK